MEKKETYQMLHREMALILQHESDPVCIMANAAALIHEYLKPWWTGFYRVVEGELRLGPFQGSVACTRIAKGRGVCGTCWAQGHTIVVPNVHEFDGHIACSSASNSEIVVPVFGRDGQIVAVLDIDSRDFAAFNDIDALWLEKICGQLGL